MRVAALLTYNEKNIQIDFLTEFLKVGRISLNEEGSLNDRYKSFGGSKGHFAEVNEEISELVHSQLKEALPYLYQSLVK